MSAVSFCSPMKSFRSGGITRRIACGRTDEAAWPACSSDRASGAAMRWLGCTDSIPARYTSVTYAV